MPGAFDKKFAPEQQAGTHKSKEVRCKCILTVSEGVILFVTLLHVSRLIVMIGIEVIDALLPHLPRRSPGGAWLLLLVSLLLPGPARGLAQRQLIFVIIIVVVVVATASDSRVISHPSSEVAL